MGYRHRRRLLCGRPNASSRLHQIIGPVREQGLPHTSRTRSANSTCRRQSARGKHRSEKKKPQGQLSNGSRFLGRIISSGGVHEDSVIGRDGGRPLCLSWRVGSG